MEDDFCCNGVLFSYCYVRKQFQEKKTGMCPKWLMILSNNLSNVRRISFAIWQLIYNQVLLGCYHEFLPTPLHGAQWTPYGGKSPNLLLHAFLISQKLLSKVGACICLPDVVLSDWRGVPPPRTLSFLLGKITGLAYFLFLFLHVSTDINFTTTISETKIAKVNSIISANSNSNLMWDEVRLSRWL